MRAHQEPGLTAVERASCLLGTPGIPQRITYSVWGDRLVEALEAAYKDGLDANRELLEEPPEPPLTPWELKWIGVDQDD
jgi:hypothetical protein